MEVRCKRQNLVAKTEIRGFGPGLSVLVGSGSFPAGPKEVVTRSSRTESAGVRGRLVLLGCGTRLDQAECRSSPGTVAGVASRARVGRRTPRRLRRRLARDCSQRRVQRSQHRAGTVARRRRLFCLFAAAAKVAVYDPGSHGEVDGSIFTHTIFAAVDGCTRCCFTVNGKDLQRGANPSSRLGEISYIR